MKKILVLLLCLFSFKVVNAERLNYEYLPYYVKVSDCIIQVKKITDNYDNILFNVSYKYYDVNNNFIKYEKVNKINYGLYFRNMYYFNRITYYGFQEKSDLNYFLTQVLVWNFVSNSNVKICDSFGREISDYNKEYQELLNKVNNHNSYSNFYNRTFESEIWSNKIFTYYQDNVVLDTPLINGLKFTTNDLKLNVYNEKVGSYTVILKKEYERRNISYSDGINYYWANFGGPDDLEKCFYYNVYGTKLTIKENLIGVNNRYGDAKNDSNYELYLDDELKLSIKELKDIYVRSNSNYTLKDISENNTVNKVDDINISVLDEEIVVVIDKYVVNKNISIGINTDEVYYVYLKSNGELYEVINSNTNLITLPYGIYYITDNDNYYKEIQVFDDIDEVLLINDKLLVEDSVLENDVVVDIEDEILEDNSVIKDDIYVDETCDNPKTGYNYYLFNILMLVISLLVIIYFYFINIKHKYFKVVN